MSLTTAVSSIFRNIISEHTIQQPMVKKCSLSKICKSTNATHRIFRLPRDKNELDVWKRAVPHGAFKKLPASLENVLLCERHWPEDYDQVSKNGKHRPKNPPTIFDGIAQSSIPTPAPLPRPSKNTLFGVRNVKKDQLDDFLQQDKLTSFDQITMKMIDLAPETISFRSSQTLFIQSTDFFNGIPKILIKIYNDFSYEAFNLGTKCSIEFLNKMRVYKLTKWSAIEETIKYLYQLPITKQKEILMQQISAMSPVVVGQNIYSPEVLIRAFEYFATSRALYQIIREDYKLPSVTLTLLTSKVSKLDEKRIISSIIDHPSNTNEDASPSPHIIVHDEIHVKQSLLYHGGTVFGRAVNDSTKLAKTVLGVMVVPLLGGKKFISKMLPVAGLTSKFLQEEIDKTTGCMRECKAHVTAIINDCLRTNQAYFKAIPTVDNKPWLIVDGTFLLFDFVHLLKNIWKLWFTEATGQLEYNDNGIIRRAKWSHLTQLFVHESSSHVKMSDLTETAISPKPVERQKVNLCLQIFSEKTHSALLNSSILDEDASDTARFIDIVLRWWKICNVRTSNLDVRKRDPLSTPVRDPKDTRLREIEAFGDLMYSMKGKSGKKRCRALTPDTAKGTSSLISLHCIIS